MPLLLVIVPGIYIAVNSTTMLYESNPILYNLTFCLIGSKITNKLIVSSFFYPFCSDWFNLTNFSGCANDQKWARHFWQRVSGAFDSFCQSVLGHKVLRVQTALDLLGEIKDHSVYEWYQFFNSFSFQLFVTFDLFWYSSTVCLEICDATGWFLFKINSPASTSSTTATSTSSHNNSSVRKNRWTNLSDMQFTHYVIIMCSSIIILPFFAVQNFFESYLSKERNLSLLLEKVCALRILSLQQKSLCFDATKKELPKS